MGRILFFLLIFFSQTFLALESMADDSQALRKKARYYFTQGNIEFAAQNLPQAYEYFKKAHNLDPSYLEPAFSYGSQRLLLNSDTLQSDFELKRSMRLMQQYVDNYPKDLYASQLYAYFTTALDTAEEAIRVLENTYALMPEQTQILPLLADTYIRTLQKKKAIETLNRYEAIEGKSKDVSLKKITFMLADKDTVAAIKEADELIKSNPRDAYNHILKGHLFEVVGNMDSVINAYKEAERLAPDNGAVKMSLAQYYRTIGDSVMLDNMVYEALLSEDFEIEDKIGILGDYLQKLLDEAGDKKRGDHLFSILQQQYPHDTDVLEMSARYAAAKGDLNQAAENIRYAIDMQPDNETYWLMLLSYEISGNNYEEAVKDYQEAKTHLSPSPQLKNIYAAAASMLNDENEAEKILNDLLFETNPDLINPGKRTEVRKSLDYDGLVWVSSIFCMLGDLNYKNGKPDNAFDLYETSLAFLPDNALTLNNYAYFLSEENRELEKAKKMSRRSLDLVDNNPTYLDTYAWILYKLGEFREALEYMELALDIAKDLGDENEEYQIHHEAIKKAVDNMDPESTEPKL